MPGVGPSNSMFNADKQFLLRQALENYRWALQHYKNSVDSMHAIIKLNRAYRCYSQHLPEQALNAHKTLLLLAHVHYTREEYSLAMIRSNELLQAADVPRELQVKAYILLSNCHLKSYAVAKHLGEDTVDETILQKIIELLRRLNVLAKNPRLNINEQRSIVENNLRLGKILQENARDIEASEFLAEARRGFISGQDHVGEALAHFHLGVSWAKQNDHCQEGLAELKMAQQQFSQLQDVQHTADTTYQLGFLSAKTSKDFGSASSYLQDAAKLYHRVKEKNSVLDSLSIEFGLSVCARHLGNKAGEEAHFRKAWAMYQGLSPTEKNQAESLIYAWEDGDNTYLNKFLDQLGLKESASAAAAIGSYRKN